MLNNKGLWRTGFLITACLMAAMICNWASAAEIPAGTPIPLETSQKTLVAGQRAHDWWQNTIQPFWKTHVQPVWHAYVQQWSKFSIPLGIVIGLVFCFLGYRLFRFALTIIGFVAGAFIVGSATHALTPSSPTVLLIAGIVGGAIGATAMIMLFPVAMFLIGAMIGAGVSVAVLTQTNLQIDFNPWLVVAGAALLCGLISLLLKKLILVIFTSVAGAWSAITAVYALTGRGAEVPDPNTMRTLTSNSSEALLFIKAHWPLFAGWAALALLGLVVQFAYTAYNIHHHHHPAHPTEPPPAE